MWGAWLSDTVHSMEDLFIEMYGPVHGSLCVLITVTIICKLLTVQLNAVNIVSRTYTERLRKEGSERSF